MIGAMGLAFASCEPALIDGPEPYAPVESTVLAEGITYTQYADEFCTQADPNGNYVKFSSAAGVVQVFLEGNTSPLYTGAGGVFVIPAKRGQEPKMNFLFRVANADGTFTEAMKTFNCTPPTELSPEMLLMVGDTGLKVWKWAATDCWGNAGHTGDASKFDEPGVVDGRWWGVDTPEDLADQLQHAGGAASGDEAAGAYMVFGEDGVVTSYDPTGTAIRSAKFEIKDYDPTRGSGWELAKLTTTEPALLFPWMINGGGTPVTEFDIMHFTAQDMTLVYTNGAEPGGWAEISFWKFIAGSPDPTTLAGTWTYAANDAYGNGGNAGSGSAFNAPGVVDGYWWGVGSADELSGQLQHAGGAATGDESAEAYMVFDGTTVTTYAPDGTKVRGGDWEAVMNDYAAGAGRGDKGWELGKLTTSEPALLFPWMINGGGTPVTEFDIMYFDAYNMTLVYTGSTSSGDWGEITHWNFVRKQETAE